MKRDPVFEWRSVFLIGFLMYLVIGAILESQVHRGEEIFFFSELRHPVSDHFFLWITHLGDFYPYVVVAVLFMIRRIFLGLFLPALGLLVLFASTSIKEFFRVPRPVPFFTETGQIDQILLVEGAEFAAGFSFPSGHSMSAFALFTFLAFLFAEKKRYQLVFLLAAILVAISRIYLVQHFLLDTLVGAFLGFLIGALLAMLYSSRVSAYDRSLLSLFGKK